MAADASLIQRSDVDFTVKAKVTHNQDGRIQVTAHAKDARDLMHAIATALGYVATQERNFDITLPH